MHNLFILLFLTSFININIAFSRSKNPVKCNKNQKYCYLADHTLIIDDKIIFLNSDSNIIAKGTVIRVMPDGHRKIRITFRALKINRSHRYILENRKDREALKDLKFYKKTIFRAFGADIGPLTASIGKGGKGFELSPYYQDRYKSFGWVIRGIFANVSTEVNFVDLETVRDTAKVTTFGILAGSSYAYWTSQKFALRGELSAGLEYASIKTIFDPSIKELGINYNAGINFSVRGAFGVLYELEKFIISANFCPQVVHSTTAIAITLGFAKRL